MLCGVSTLDIGGIHISGGGGGGKFFTRKVPKFGGP